MKIQNPNHLSLSDSAFGGGLVIPYLEHRPVLGENVFIAPHAAVIGRATLGNNVSIWFGSVLRADIARIEVGDGSNIQDLCVMHVGNLSPCIVGKNVVVGHHVTLHGCVVEDDCVIGMGSVILDDAVIGKGSVVGAGTLVTKRMKVPPFSLVLGSPGKVVRPLTDTERNEQSVFAPKYVKIASNYRATLDRPNDLNQS